MCGYLQGTFTDEQKRERLALNLVKAIKEDTDPKLAKSVIQAAKHLLDGKVN